MVLLNPGYDVVNSRPDVLQIQWMWLFRECIYKQMIRLKLKDDIHPSHRTAV